jgi:hypothetical protein
MTEDTKLCAQRIDNCQSEIWLDADGKELTQRRELATNEVLNVTRRHFAFEVFEMFYASYRMNIGHIATLTAPNLDEIVAELRLKA